MAEQASKWSSQLDRVIRLEIIRFQIAAVSLFVIGVISLVCGFVAILYAGFKVAWESVALFAVAAICFALPLLKKIDLSKDGAGIEPGGNVVATLQDIIEKEQAKAETQRVATFEQTRQQVGALSAQVEELSDTLTKPEGHALTEAALKEAEPTLREIKKLLPVPTVENDLQKNRFGGKEESNGRRLTATVEKSSFGRGWVTLTLKVVPTNNKPLQGKYVYFFLHDSFDPDVYRISVTRHGDATLEISAQGAFTAGAVADRAKTLLELDLETSKSIEAPKWFRKSE